MIYPLRVVARISLYMPLNFLTVKIRLQLGFGLL